MGHALYVALAFLLMTCQMVLVVCGDGNQLRFVSLNLFEGGGSPTGNRMQRIRHWLQAEAFDVVGLDELNGWNEDRLAREAATWGHGNSAFLPTSSGYHLGLTSRLPLQVVEQVHSGFHHGLLHVLVCNHVSVFLTHLSPVSGDERQREAGRIGALIQHEHHLALLMGDLNSLSKLDHVAYEEERLWERFVHDPQSHALARKYVWNDFLDYRTTNTLFDWFVDLGYMLDLAHDLPLPLSWSVPTAFRADAMNGIPMRIDYLLGTPPVLPFAHSCRVIRDNHTNTLSDHYPIACTFAGSMCTMSDGT